MNELKSEAVDTMKPGMDHIVQAGQQIVIADNKGEEFSVSVRESDGVMKFIVAFDLMRTAKKQCVEGVVMAALTQDVEHAFLSLPRHVVKNLPSITDRPVPAWTPPFSNPS